jgi:hypothetical protein
MLVANVLRWFCLDAAHIFFIFTLLCHNIEHQHQAAYLVDCVACTDILNPQKKIFS